MDETLKELEDSEVPESDEGKGAVAMKLKHKLITELNKLLFNNTSDMEGGENVRRLFNLFCEAVYKVRKHRLTRVTEKGFVEWTNFFNLGLCRMDKFLQFSGVRLS